MANSELCSFVIDITASENIASNRIVDYANGEAGAAALGKGISVAAIGSGSTGRIIALGVGSIELGEEVYTGDSICSGVGGKGVGLSGSNPVIGYALEDGSNGDFIQILLK